jgi:hypothetical protein
MPDWRSLFPRLFSRQKPDLASQRRSRGQLAGAIFQNPFAKQTIYDVLKPRKTTINYLDDFGDS